VFDIVPPASGVPQGRLVPRPSKATLKLTWKLPARLRRPIRQELKREQGRARKPKLMEAPAGFRRHRLKPAKTATSRLVVPSPPYAGGYLQQATGEKQATSLAQDRRRKTAKARIKLDASDRIVSPVQMNVLAPEELAAESGKRKWWRRGGAAQLVLFVVGCGLMSGIVWQVKGIGKGVAVAGTVQEGVWAAYEQLQVAQVALAETDFAKSGEAFADAGSKLRQAESELDRALWGSKRILEKLDITGTVQSGTHVLAAGEALTRAGEHFSRGIKWLVEPRLVIQDREQAEQEKPETLVDALARARPEFEQAATALQEAEESVKGVSPEHLPGEIRSSWVEVTSLVPQVRKALSGFLDQSELIFSILGAEKERQYLIVFQNHHEIRPTGGFIGSLALVNVDHGVVENIAVQSTYDPDGQLKEYIAPPEPLTVITPRWWLRDANWFVNYEISAKKIAAFFEKEGGPTVDGVISITPEVIRQLLAVTGPIHLPTYGVMVDADNFIPLTQELVTYNYDREVNKPKQFLADLTPILMNRLFENKASEAAGSLGMLGKMLKEKHLLFYFKDPELQAAVQELGWAGNLPALAPGQNFLMVNNANIGGHKSDQFMEQEIDARTEVRDDGTVEMVVTIRRTHRGPEEKLPYNYPPEEDPAWRSNVVYQRTLVPQGAALLEARGFTVAAEIPREKFPMEGMDLKPDPLVVQWEGQQQAHPSGTVVGEEGGYTYFANWMKTAPGSTSIGLYRYRLPVKVKLPGFLDAYKSHSLYLAKQPGDERTQVRATFSLPKGLKVTRFLPEEGVTSTNEGLVWRGYLRQDTVIGLIYE
jgi:hypothetical protein